jgi:hypothetical protein
MLMDIKELVQKKKEGQIPHPYSPNSVFSLLVYNMSTLMSVSELVVASQRLTSPHQRQRH